jgi:hypothetical protein
MGAQGRIADENQRCPRLYGGPCHRSNDHRNARATLGRPLGDRSTLGIVGVRLRIVRFAERGGTTWKRGGDGGIATNWRRRNPRVRERARMRLREWRCRRGGRNRHFGTRKWRSKCHRCATGRRNSRRRFRRRSRRGGRCVGGRDHHRGRRRGDAFEGFVVAVSAGIEASHSRFFENYRARRSRPPSRCVFGGIAGCRKGTGGTRRLHACVAPSTGPRRAGTFDGNGRAGARGRRGSACGVGEGRLKALQYRFKGTPRTDADFAGGTCEQMKNQFATISVPFPTKERHARVGGNPTSSKQLGEGG